MNSLDPNRTIYPSAPLNLVACAIDFSPVTHFDTAEGHSELYALIREGFPILGEPPMLQWTLNPSGAQQTSQGARFLSRDRTQSAVLLPTKLTLETSRYSRFEEFSKSFKSLLEALETVSPIPSLQRVGLRYIDEISISEVQHVTDWSKYIAADLLSPVNHFVDLNFDLDMTEYQAATRFQMENDKSLVFRFGINQEPVVDGNGPLLIRKTPEGTYFLMDLDSSWKAPQNAFPEFSIGQVMTVLNELHHPIRDIFEQSIEDPLRQMLLEENDDE